MQLNLTILAGIRLIIIVVLATIMITIVDPIVQPIINLIPTGMMNTAAYIIKYLIYFFVSLIFPFMIFTNKKKEVTTPNA